METKTNSLLIDYFKNVLGVQFLQMPHHLVAKSHRELNSSTQHTKNLNEVQQPFDLVVLHLGQGLFQGDTGELWNKMRTAMKLENLKILEKEITKNLESLDLLETLGNVKTTHVLYLTPTPDRNLARRVNEIDIYECYSPRALIENTNLKKEAWNKLQELVRSVHEKLKT